MAQSKATDIPEYDNPPVTEVVCGVMFKTLDGLQIPHFGLFWEYFKKDYPICQEVAPLMPLQERFDDDIAEEVQFGGVPLPRVWFLHREETGIIQLQRDRFLHNWKKNKPTDSYPRYHVVIGLFKRHLDSFEAFVSDQKIGHINPFQYEMTYVNHIPQGDGWNQLSDLGQVFRDYHWEEKGFLPKCEHLNLRESFRLPENMGRLHISIRNARRREDKKPILLFELTVRGFPGNESREAMWHWFDVAREWIVRGFTDLTESSIQKNTWKRTK